MGEGVHEAGRECLGHGLECEEQAAGGAFVYTYTRQWVELYLEQGERRCAGQQ